MKSSTDRVSLFLALFLFAAAWPANLLHAGGKRGGDAAPAEPARQSDADPNAAMQAIYDLIDTGKIPEAVGAATKLTNSNPEYAPGWGLLAWLHYGLQDAAAPATLEKCLALDEYCPEGVVVKVNLLAQGNDLAGATSLLDSAQKQYPDSATLMILRGDLQAASQDLAGARQTLTAAREKAVMPRDHCMASAKLGAVAAATSDWPAAEAAYSAAIAVRDVPQLRLTRADMRLKSGNFRGAWEDVKAIAASEMAQDAAAKARIDGMINQVLQQWTTAKGPVEPLGWQLRYAPGDAALENRIAAVVEEIAAAGDGHPFKEYVKPPELKQDAVANARVSIPESMEDARLKVNNAIFNNCHPYLVGENWNGLIDFCTEQLASYPEAGTYGMRAEARFWLKDYAGALKDAGVAIAMEALEVSENQSRPILQSGGFGLTDMEQYRQLCVFLRRLAANIPNDDDKALLETLDAQAAGEWLRAHECFERLKPQDAFAAYPYPLTLCEQQFKRKHIGELVSVMAEQGRAALSAGDTAAAYAMDEKIQSLYSLEAEACFYSAECAMSRGDRPRTETWLANVYDKNPFHAGAHRMSAGMCRENSDSRMALLHFNAGAGGEAAAALQGHAQACALERDAMEQTIGAEAVYQTYLDGVNALLADTDKSRAKRNSTLCVPGFTRMLAMGGARSDLLQYRALHLFYLSKWEEAGADARTLMAEDASKAVWCWGMIGDCAYNAKRYPEAAEAYSHFLEQNPDNVAAWGVCGYAWYHGGNHDKAFDAFGKAIALNTDDPFIYMEYAEILAERGRWQDAVDAAGKAMEMAGEREMTGLTVRASSSVMRWSQRALEELLK